MGRPEGQPDVVQRAASRAAIRLRRPMAGAEGHRSHQKALMRRQVKAGKRGRGKEAMKLHQKTACYVSKMEKEAEGTLSSCPVLGRWEGGNTRLPLLLFWSCRVQVGIITDS
jgi:hypothetical protein